jgi:hypothetical protein
MGLLFIPQVVYDYGEPRWNYTDRGNPKNSERSACLNIGRCTSTGLHSDVPLKAVTFTLAAVKALNLRAIIS